MSDGQHILADLLKNDCFANDRRFEMHFSGGRNGRIRSGAGETSSDNAAEVLPDRKVGRNSSALGVTFSTSSLIGGLGWGAKMMILRPLNVCSARGMMAFGRWPRNATPAALHLVPLPTDRRPAPAGRAHHGAELSGLTPSHPVRHFTMHRERFFPCDSRRQMRARICDGPRHGHRQSSSPMFFNPEQPS
jgi:hypothetical protein